MPEEDRFVIPDLRRIGKYDVLERIADGGFATLYRGRDPFLKRLVAIKVCASEDPELRQQFLREAEIAGNLDHPSIVRTFDFGFDQVGPYLVQEYLHGEDLSRLIERRAPLSPRRRLDLLIQIAEGLAYSHAQRVLHLDVKPANVRVLGQRQAKLLDFGIARLATSDGATGVGGGMIGTAGYLPPEQVMGKRVDVRSDVFAFGALAYELLTFSRPFSGGTMGELLKRVLEAEAEPMTRHWPDCGDRLANLIGRCLRRDPAARYPGFDALLPELIAARDGLPEIAESEIADGAGHEAGATSNPETAATVAQAIDAAEAPSSRPSSSTTAQPGGPSRSRRVLVAVSVAASLALTVLALLSLVPASEPAAVATAEADPYVPAGPGPSPGVLMVTAAPWGEITRLTAADGTVLDLPGGRVTPLRLWVAPGRHEAEIALPSGELATCWVDVVEGGTHRCHLTGTGEAPRTSEYWKEMGWWR